MSHQPTRPDDAFDPTRGSEDAFDPTRGVEPLSEDGPRVPPVPMPPERDPFDPESLRLSQDFDTTVERYQEIGVRKPPKGQFVRVHPDPDYSLATTTLTFDREDYLVAPNMREALGSSVQLRSLRLAVDRDGNAFVWPVPMPAPNGRTNSWHQSAARASDMAKRSWVRVESNLTRGAYDVLVAKGDLGEPKWPNLDFKDVLRRAFEGKYIDSPDHIVCKRLRGEI